ncbi:hypothetical protein MRX96_026621 [Rhipicephalus microplus]
MHSSAGVSKVHATRLHRAERTETATAPVWPPTLARGTLIKVGHRKERAISIRPIRRRHFEDASRQGQDPRTRLGPAAGGLRQSLQRALLGTKERFFVPDIGKLSGSSSGPRGLLQSFRRPKDKVRAPPALFSSLVAPGRIASAALRVSDAFMTRAAAPPERPRTVSIALSGRPWCPVAGCPERKRL